MSAKKFFQRSKEESIVSREEDFRIEQNSYFFTFSPNNQEKIILAPQTSVDEDDASAKNASATRATGGQ